MQNLWNVYRLDGSFLGPLTPVEIRNALREGQIDPFDQVSRVNSNLKIDLVEVDEIFRIADGDASESARDSVYDSSETDEKKGLHPDNPPIRSKDFSQSDVGTRPAAKPFVDQLRPNNVSPETPAMRRIKKKTPLRRNPKRFNLQDRKKRILGPLSAVEIQSLFYRGILDNKVMVQKIGTTRWVPVTQFVSVYSGAKFNEFKSEISRIDLEAGNKMNIPCSRVIEEVTRAIALKNFPKVRPFPVFIIILIVAIGAGGYLGHKAFPNFQPSIKKIFSSPAKPNIKSAVQVDNQATQILPDGNVQEPSEITVVPADDDRGNDNTKKANTSKKMQKEKKQKKNSKKRDDVGYSRPRTPVTIGVATNPTLYRNNPSQPPKNQNQPGLAAKLVNTPKGSSDPYAQNIGKVMTLNSMRFDKTALNNCALKCLLTFRNPAGKQIDGIFFKGAYQDSLIKSSGVVTITGRIGKQGGDYIIYLQGIK